MRTIARFAIEKRWLVIVGWIAFIALVQGLSSGLGGADYKDTFSLPHTETDKVMHLLDASGQSDQNGVSGQVVLHAKSGTLDSAPADAAKAFAGLCADKLDVVNVTSPWAGINCVNGTAQPDAGQPSLLSKDKTIAIVDVTWKSKQYDQSLFDGVYNHLKPLNSSQLQVEFTGDAFQGQGQSEGGIPPFLIGFLAALVVLGFVFRTVGATALPLASAVAALTSGLGLIGMLTHAMSVSNVTPQLTELMVIGVGVDYALFIVTRHRRNLRRGMSVEESILSAIDTSGRAVVFAGTTVCIAMLGLIALGVSFFYGMAIGVAVAVLMTMAASLTLLPALLRFLGLKVLTRKQRREVRAGIYHDPHNVGFWARWSKLISRRNIAFGALGAVVMIVLAIPFLSMRLGHADQGNDPANTTTRKGYDLIAQGFGKGFNSTLTLVVDGKNAHAVAEQAGTALAKVDNVDPASIFVPAKGLTPDLSLVSFKSLTTPQDAKTTDLVHQLRGTVLPKIYNGTGDHIYVYGQTAIQVDFAHVLSAKMPLFIGSVVLLSFILLLIAFRSVVVPLTAAVMNLLAAGASFGVVVAIFQWGWLSDALGIGKGGPIEAWAPVLFFAIIFGLSMDYQVFLVSRMHEEWVHTRDNRRAIRVGQAETGGIITAAALIMIMVFMGFVLDPNRVVKLLGIGLASAVFLDAFILRTILVPSLMHTIGKSNWFFPKWLEKVTPRVSVEPADDGWTPEPGDEPDRELSPV
ncbi:MAG TPA: MMPL family transporter [Jatrophihabitantaceae bacterium]|jgi:RND superfamily putative drug exporter|nr:MMPL family transporter [Jatrophihabitantaceae bacterium]